MAKKQYYKMPPMDDVVEASKRITDFLDRVPEKWQCGVLSGMILGTMAHLGQGYEVGLEILDHVREEYIECMRKTN